MYAIVDIETTGGHYSGNRIIEIAIVISDGQKVLDTYSSLVNPEQYIPDFIYRLTGITNEMVDSAPRFSEIAKKVFELTEDKVFVAHNVGFDYSFVKSEFNSFGATFQRKKLCTVRLSRKIVPGFPSYSLGNLCRSMNIQVENRHRALGDAEATTEVLHQLIRKDDEGFIQESLNGKSREATLPPNLSKSIFENVPEETGVYYFHDDKNKVIYVGKAKNIKKRLLSHFSHSSKKAIIMKNDIHDVSYNLTGNELSALLLESHEIKHLYPIYNQSQKWKQENCGVTLYTNKQGFSQFGIGRINKAHDPVLTFRNKVDAYDFMRNLIDSHELCGRFGGIQTGKGACWNYHLKKCRGTCIGEEDPEIYNTRVRKAVESFSLFKQSFVIVEKGRQRGEMSLILIMDGRYRGFGFMDLSESLTTVEDACNHITPYKDNQDVRRIISQYLKSKKRKRILRNSVTQIHENLEIFPTLTSVDIEVGIEAFY